MLQLLSLCSRSLCHNEHPEQPNRRAEVKNRREREACVCWAGHIIQVSKRSYLYLLLSSLSWVGGERQTPKSTGQGGEGVVLPLRDS